MSKKEEKKKGKRIDVKKELVRVLVLLLAFMMVAGTIVSIIVSLPSDEAVPAAQAASTAVFSPDHKIRVGLAFDSSASETVPLVSETGYTFGCLDKNNTYTESFVYKPKNVTVTGDGNFLLSSGAVTAADASSATIGGYSVLLPNEPGTSFPELADLNGRLSSLGSAYYVYPGVISGKNVYLVGAFLTSSDAYSAKSRVSSVIPGASVQAPTDTALRAVCTDDGKTVFRYDAGTSGKEFALASRKNAGYTYPYMKFKGYKYEEVFECRQMKPGQIRVVNVLPLDTYIAGIIPYEISAAWPAAAQMAFSVTVRNYTLNAIGYHASKGFDCCNTTCCQVYRGIGGTTTAVRNFIKETDSIVCTYNGKLEKQYYYASCGGTTANVADVWGGTGYPYLVGRPTPWEKYADHSNGSWTTQITPSALYSRLKSKGYTSLNSEIVSIRINSTCENSCYVNSVTVTDKNGNSVTIRNCDKIRTAFGLNSANFLVGKAGETVTYTEYGLKGYGEFAGEGTGFADLTVMTADGPKTFNASSGLKAITSKGVLDLSVNLWMNTASSTEKFAAYISPELPKTKESGLLDFNRLEVASKTKQMKLTGTAGNFVFVGRGWGHGVGGSQDGYYDLAVLGYTWKEILGFYFPGSEFVKYTELTK